MKQRKLSSKAYDWAIRLQAGDIRELELDEYLDWVESNPQEAEGVEELGSLWEELAFAEVDPPLSLQGHTAYRPHVFFGVIEMIRMLFTPSSVVALLTIFTIASISTFFLIEDESGVVYQTARAEMTTVNLADGSTAHMNVLSKIRVSFSDNERHIILDEGEVSFDVFPDSNRPFIVSIDDSEVYALGTEFNVKLNQERALSVILVEGRIRVSTNLNGEQGVVTEILSEPGEQAQILPVFLNPRGRSQLLQTSIDVSIKEIATALAWRQEQLIFEGQTLADAILEINRHTTHTIRLLDPSIGQDMRVYGVFNSGDWEGFISGIELSYPLRGERVRSDVTILRSISRN